MHDRKVIALRELKAAEAELLARLSQVRKALSVLGESETDAALKRPRRRADTLAGIQARSGFALPLPYLVRDCASACPWLPRRASSFSKNGPEFNATMLFAQ